MGCNQSVKLDPSANASRLAKEEIETIVVYEITDNSHKLAKDTSNKLNSDASETESEVYSTKKGGKKQGSDIDDNHSSKGKDDEISDVSSLKDYCIQPYYPRLAGQNFDEDYAEGRDSRRVDPLTTSFRDQTGDLKR